jgi:hypothetical protein
MRYAMSIDYQTYELRPVEAVDPAATASAALFTDLLAAALWINPMHNALKAGRIKQLVACCAWTDAALALLALEQPRWQLRRLAYDDGEWHCALSKNREIPEWLDIDVETHHADMALAIVGALLQARSENIARSEVAMGPGAPDASWEPALCDNFA